MTRPWVGRRVLRQAAAGRWGPQIAYRCWPFRFDVSYGRPGHAHFWSLCWFGRGEPLISVTLHGTRAAGFYTPGCAWEPRGVRVRRLVIRFGRPLQSLARWITHGAA